LELCIAEFERSVNEIAKSFSEAVSGIYDDLGELREEWDR
jgi:hypothetical protein